jgi:membrane protease YdiL (CAAX protease family)
MDPLLIEESLNHNRDIMSENIPAFLPPADASIAPPSTDLQRAPATAGEVAVPPEWHPELELPQRSLAQEPRWPHPNLRWSFLWCLLFVIVTQVPGAFIAIAVVAALSILSPKTLPLETLRTPAALLKSEAMNVALGVAFFITELLVIGFSWLIIRLVVGPDWKRQLALRRPSLTHTLLALASFPALVLLANIAYELLRKVFHVPSLADYGLSGMEEMVEIFSKWPWGFAVLVIGLGPGIGEELWCRGFLGRGLVGNYGVVFGVLASSFFFGLIHIDPCQGMMAMLMGLWLHYVYLTTRSLLLPMMLHTLNNSLAVVITRVPQLRDIETDPSAIPLIVFVSAVLLLLGVAFALYQSRARLAAKMPEQILAWRPAFEGVECPPAESGMQVVHPSPPLAAAALAGGGFLLFVLACVAWAYQG